MASKTSDAEITMLYTTEKRTALLKALKSQRTIVDSSVAALKQVQEDIDRFYTIDDLEKKARVQRVISNLKYERELIDSFVTELGQ